MLVVLSQHAGFDIAGGDVAITIRCCCNVAVDDVVNLHGSVMLKLNTTSHTWWILTSFTEEKMIQ